MDMSPPVATHPRLLDAAVQGQRIVAQAVEQFGGIDIWVNNAGIFPSEKILEMSDALWDQVLDVNVRGVFAGAREAAKRLPCGPLLRPYADPLRR